MKTKEFNELVGLIGIGALTENEALSNNLTEMQVNIVKGMFTSVQNTEDTEDTEPAGDTEPANEPAGDTEPDQPKPAVTIKPKYKVGEVNKQAAALKRAFAKMQKEILTLSQMITIAVDYAKDYGITNDALNHVCFDFLAKLSEAGGYQIDYSVSEKAIVRFILKKIKRIAPYQTTDGTLCSLKDVSCNVITKDGHKETTCYKVVKASNVQLLGDCVKAIKYGVSPIKDLEIYDPQEPAYYTAKEVKKLSKNEKKGVISALTKVSDAAATQIRYYELQGKYDRTADALKKATESIANMQTAYKQAVRATNSI